MPGLTLRALILLTGAASLLGTATPSRTLSFEDRVRAQEAIERVYYSYQIGATKPFEEAVPLEVLETKVRTYLKQSVALEEFWRTPVTAGMLQRELQRMARGTRMPDRLTELFSALAYDPVLILECIARPAVVDRLTRNFFAFDERIHGNARTEAEILRQDLLSQRINPYAEGPRRALFEIMRDVEGVHSNTVPSAVELHGHWRSDAISQKLSPEDFDRWMHELPRDVGEISPLAENSDQFEVRVVLDREVDRVGVVSYRVEKRSWEDWWAAHEGDFVESEVLAVAQEDNQSLTLPAITSGLHDEFHPEQLSHCASDDAWAPTATTLAPVGRGYHTTIWTGSLMVVWGGVDNSGLLNTGGRYDPASDTWTPTSINGAPSAREIHSAVWTGDLMVVWGGFDRSFPITGGRYNPSTNSWTPTSTINVPSGRWDHTAVWTGTSMVVWGGHRQDATSTLLNTGGRYDPVADRWTPTSLTSAPSSRFVHTAVWTGSRMVVWGGGGVGNSTGGRYDPLTDTWAPTSTINAPSPRGYHTAIWTGSIMVVWGGTNSSNYLSTGGRYDPATDTWAPTSTANAPSARVYHSAVWAGSLMVIWGGRDLAAFYLNTGGRYDSTTDTWMSTSITNAPSARGYHTAIWTGSFMVMWGGYDGDYTSVGGRYAFGLTLDNDGDGFSECDGDCNDANPGINPAAMEICDGLDNDCDVLIDEDLGITTCGLGACEHTVANCVSGTTYSCNPLDGVSSEICDGLDNDCDGTADNGNPGGGVACGSNIGTCRQGVTACTGGALICSGSVEPTAEICDGLDNDCDSVVPANEADEDGDGFRVCQGDCNDRDTSTHPGGVELPGNAADENCDGVLACNPSAFYRTHGDFVRCVAHDCAQLVTTGLVPQAQCDAIISQAAQSNVGRRARRHVPVVPTAP